MGKPISVCGAVSPPVLLLNTCSSFEVVPKTVPPLIAENEPDELLKLYEFD
jgi:hypothetical protein